MHFSMIFEVQLANPTREDERRGYHETVEQALLAEEVGFDRVWAVEHHNLRYYAHCTAPEILLTHIAARTRRIRIGHGVVLLPGRYNHPLRVAERIAALDILSDGRADFAPAAGSGAAAAPPPGGVGGAPAASAPSPPRRGGGGPRPTPPGGGPGPPSRPRGNSSDPPPPSPPPPRGQPPPPPLYVA